ncbi:uncharacterized protein V6R79_024802 [Siganus canaliculatus]
MTGHVWLSGSVTTAGRKRLNEVQTNKQAGFSDKMAMCTSANERHLSPVTHVSGYLMGLNGLRCFWRSEALTRMILFAHGIAAAASCIYNSLNRLVNMNAPADTPSRQDINTGDFTFLQHIQDHTGVCITPQSSLNADVRGKAMIISQLKQK